jgi:excisionase family DNA binding protein
MLNTAEAARFLRVSQASIRRWADSGRLPASRVGGRRERRFKESDLVAFMDHSSNRRGGAANIGGAQVSAPGHLASFYSSDEGGMRLSIPFFADGLRQGQPCILVAGKAVASRYTTALNPKPGDSFTAAVFAGGTAAGAIAEWERRLSELVAGGATLIRVVGEMASEREMFDSEEEMLRYEEAFDLMSRRYPVIVICQYDARVFSGATLVRALKAHPDLFDMRLGSFLN